MQVEFRREVRRIFDEISGITDREQEDRKSGREGAVRPGRILPHGGSLSGQRRRRRLRHHARTGIVGMNAVRQ